MELTRLGDELGPVKIVVLREPSVGLNAIVVVDNVACGAAIGGIRMAADVGIEETMRLARAMTLKNAAAGLPHGGAKAAIIHDPACGAERKQAVIRSFARAMRDLAEYTPGPDMGTDERCMAWIRDEIGRAVGLPRVLGGIPLDGARVAIQGFGAVGQHAARFLAKRGARLVAASDSQGTVQNADGLPIEALIAHKRAAKLATFPGGRSAPRDAILGVECDIWIPAARPDVLGEAEARNLRAKLVLQGANIPATPAAEKILHERGVLNIVDFIANAGGVICAAVEYAGGTEEQALSVIGTRIRANVRELIMRVQSDKLPPREAAVAMATSRVHEAMSYRIRRT